MSSKTEPELIIVSKNNKYYIEKGGVQIEISVSDIQLLKTLIIHLQVKDL